MKFMKKNQVIIAVIGLMLMTAGYLNFTNNSSLNINQTIEAGSLADTIDMAEIGDAKLVSGKPANDSKLEETNTVKTGTEVKSDKKDDDKATTEKKVDTLNQSKKEEDKDLLETNNNITTDEYFTKSRLERDTMYSQMIESYQKILEKTTVSEKQRQTAQTEITKINEQKNAIMITENLIKTKGFEDLIIFVNDKSINVIVKIKQLKSEQIAQIQNIITRELKAKIDNIHISNKN